MANIKYDASKKTRLVLMLGLLFLMIIAMICVILAIAPSGRGYKIGENANNTVLARFDIEDRGATQRLRIAAEADVDPIYYVDVSKVNQSQLELFTILTALEDTSARAYEILDERSASFEAFRKFRTQTPTRAEWSEIIGEDMQDMVKSSGGFSQDLLLDILALPREEFERWLLNWRQTHALYIKDLLSKGIGENNLAASTEDFVRELNKEYPSLQQVNLYMASKSIVSTRAIDEARTKAEMERRKNSVAPVIIERGAPLINKGEVISAEKMQLLEDAGIVIAQISFEKRMLGISILVVLLTFALASYIGMNTKMAINMKSTLILIIVLTFSLLTAVLAGLLDNSFSPVYLVVALVALLISRDVAIISIVAMAPILAMISLGATLDYVKFFETLFQTLTGGLLGMVALRKAGGRSAVFIGSVVCGVGMSLVSVGMVVLNEGALDLELMTSMMWSMGSSVIFAVLSVGLLPLLESLFDVVTPSRLVELGNANNPLLQRLMMEAPGTYHHSIMTASLAESAANAIGANALLARVGSYYHDIGKLRRPLFFKENQQDNNPHDKLDGESSAAILLAHPKDGISYAQKYKLPGEIKRLISEHHGTTLAIYFYNKAVEESGNKSLSQQNFRYSGPKPATKESAIIMIADSVEAAVRSLKTVNHDAIDETTRRIVKGKMDDGQLSNTQLTLPEIETIIRAMVKTFGGLLHERIEYPDIEKSIEATNG